LIAGKRTSLAGWPGFHRTTLLMKCADLTGERSWLRRHTNGEDVEYQYWRHDTLEAAFEETGASTAAGDYASLMMEWNFPAGDRRPFAGRHLCHRTRQRDIPALGLLRMIEEYARHNGHAGLLRELVDGTTGS
jgi:hypothetical protein